MYVSIYETAGLGFGILWIRLIGPAAACHCVPMKAPLSRLAEPAYAVFRIVVGGLFAFHGAQKLFGAFGGPAQHLMSQMGLAGIIEFVGGLLVATGLFTSIAAFIACGEMAVAYFTVHAHMGRWPIVNRGELAVLYCFSFLLIAARGAGMLSLDRILGRGR